ncbi:MAG: hypothetical protein EOP83_18455 [Verrucomicrobiaceae bacterium]|nr:MAG: hypothetical protein EOP83_18455 [Verrucomicrobiaceae bacterium]
MKPVVVTAIALLSFAAGWVIKPTPDAVAEGASTQNGAPKGSGKGSGADYGELRDGKISDRRLVLPKRGVAAGGPIDPTPETVSAQVRFEETFGNAANRAERARLSRLSEALGLSTEQQEALRNMLDIRRDGFRNLQGSNHDPAAAIQQAGISEKNFMEDVKKVLDPEQVAAFESFKQREKDNDIEAKAQRDVADLIGQVDLSEQQREQALVVMRQLSETAAAKRPAGWDVMNEAVGMLGGSQAAVMDDLGGVMDDPSIMKDPQAIQRKLLETQRATAEARVAALKSILTPGQLSQYRANLETRSAVMENFTPPPVEPPR